MSHNPEIVHLSDLPEGISSLGLSLYRRENGIVRRVVTPMPHVSPDNSLAVAEPKFYRLRTSIQKEALSVFKQSDSLVRFFYTFM